jgi:CheY-like chemotaxis protein
MGFFIYQRITKCQKTNYDKQPIIAVTGRNDLILEEYTEAGFITVVRKPYSQKYYSLYAIYIIAKYRIKSKKIKRDQNS